MLRHLIPAVLVLMGWLTGSIGAFAQDDGVDLCIRAFGDSNRNGEFDADEPSFAGISVFVRKDGTVIGSLVTSEDEDCLRSLRPGEFVVTFEDAASYTLTTPTEVTVTLIDEAIAVDVGAVATEVDVEAFRGNQICILVFEDLNMNNQRDGGEGLLAGMDVNLLVEDIIVETLVTNQQEPVCFDELGIAEYRVVIPPTPRHFLITRNDAAIGFQDTGNLITAPFGAQTIDPLRVIERPASDDLADRFDLDQDTRLLMASMGALVAILFMVGLGSVLYGLLRR